MEKPIRATPLAVRLIPNIDSQFAEKLNLPPHIRSLGLLTSTIDDVGYTAFVIFGINDNNGRPPRFPFLFGQAPTIEA